MNYSTYHELINEEFEKRKALNASYSLRAFARDLGLSPATLSQVFNKKNGLSLEAAELISQKLRLSEPQKNWFLNSVGSLHCRNSKERLSFQEKIKQLKQETTAYSEIQLEYFKVISDWYHFAILELTHLKEFQNDYQWIAEKLGVEAHQAEEAIERMKALDLIEERKGKLVDVFTALATTNDIPSMSIKKFHMQIMKKAMEALYEVDPSEREISSTVFSFDKNDLPLVKEKIRSFRRELENDSQLSKKKNAVYCLGIQFFELTKGSSHE